MNQHPPILIQSRRNGKYYPVNEDSGEVELDKGERIMKLTLEYNYELVDSNDNFWVYKKKTKRSFIQKLLSQF